MANLYVSASLDPEKTNLEFDLCIICQKGEKESLVCKPSIDSYGKVLDFVKEWASYGNKQYSEAWVKLQDISVKDLEEKGSSWHRSCYKGVAHTGMIKRAKERYERELSGPNESRRKSRSGADNITPERSQLTRSQTSPLDKDACFFCDGQAGYREMLFNVRTLSGGESLRKAITLSGNEKLAVKLNTAIASNDAHSIDIKYHKNCWLNSVTNILRKPAPASGVPVRMASQIAAKIEFLTLTDITLSDGKIVPISQLQAAYKEILNANNVANETMNRKALKQLLQNEIADIEFHRPKRVNESERVSAKKGRDRAIQKTEDQDDMKDDEMKTLFDAAALIRKSIRKCKKWLFTGSLDNITDEHVPMELFSFFRWVIQGPFDLLSLEKKSSEVHKRAMSLTQSTVAMCLSDRQVKHKKSETTRMTAEMPQQLAIGLAVHQAVRSKELISLLHGFGMSVDYNRVLRVESQIESNVLQRMEQNDSVYLPPDIVKGRHVFFAIDNVDFAEDTPDGKRTFHGTAMAIYQRADAQDQVVHVNVDPTLQGRSIKDLPDSITSLVECPAPPLKPKGPVNAKFSLAVKELPIQIRMQDAAWLLGRNVTRIQADNSQAIEATEQLDTQPKKITSIPVWSAYNSLVTDPIPTTRVGTPPLVAAPAHEWSTLLTVLMQAQCISVKVVGPTRKTVISLDLGLYQPAKKLQMARRDLKHLILRPGELHIVMAALRAIGAYIDNSGIDTCWIEAELYGPSTVKQILGGKHVKRAQTAHMITLQALFLMYHEAVMEEDPNSHRSLEESVTQLSDACANGSKDAVKEAHDRLVSTIESQKIIEKMDVFDKEKEKSPLFKVVRQYMRMVMEMMTFIRAVRTGDWALHLEALEVFTKYFFAHDMLNYARMIPVYLAEMHMLEESDPEIYEEFQRGNWVVNKNPCVSFCSLGADNALEHVNRSMKVSGGLIGITLNPNARSKYFLIAPELARLAEKAKEMSGMSACKTEKHHHSLSTAVRARQEKHIEQLATSFRNFTNPFLDESSDLFNIATKVVMPDKVKEDLCQQSAVGTQLLSRFVEERVTTGTYSIWYPMKKRKLNTWKSATKVIRVKANDKVIELKEDRSLFARMSLVAKSRPEIDIKEAVGEFEFNVVPKSMFAPDGSMLHCSCKSALMAILEKLDGTRTGSNTEEHEIPPPERTATRMKVSLVGGMAEVQALDKPSWVKNCLQLAEHFSTRIFAKYDESDEVRLIFDR